MNCSDPVHRARTTPSETSRGGRIVSYRRVVGRWQLRAAAGALLAISVAGCSAGSAAPSSGSQATTTAPAGGSGSSAATPLAQAVAYSLCIRSHGVPNFPDPVQTPDGGYGYRTSGIDPNSAAFQVALQACKALPSPWNSTGEQLSSAEQQAWLTWAQCIRVHGLPSFPDPTFSGTDVHDSGLRSSSPQLQSAMDACKSQKPSVGGLGG